MPQETGAAERRGDDAAAQQVGLLQGGEYGGEHQGRRHRGEEHAQQGRLLADEEHVDVRTAQRGHRRTDGHQQEAGDHGGEHGARRAAQTGRQRAHDALLAAGAAEARAGLEDERDAGEAGVELVHGDEPAPLAGVVDVHAPAAEAAAHALVDDVVVELPEEDGRRVHPGERGQVHLHALGREPVTAGGLEEVAGAGAVPGHPTGDAQLLQGHEAAEVAEHHGQRGGAALHRLHLQHGGRAYGTGRAALGDGRTAAPAPAGRDPGGRGPGAGPVRGGVLRHGHGSSQSTGRCAARWTAPVTGVVESTGYGGPPAEDHR